MTSEEDIIAATEKPPETAPRLQRRAYGKTLCKRVPYSSHGAWVPDPERPDPISLLQEQDASRVQHLVPIKYGRMSPTPFAFLRGSAAVMAADLSKTPSTGLEVQLCGDAHLSSFGVFATPERKLVFDLNDFDETHPGPWEWDLKRLAASAVVAGRVNGFSESANRMLAVAVTERYAEAMGTFAQARTLDVWYYYVGVERVQEAFERSSKKARRSVQRMVGKARRQTQEQTLEKLTHVIDGHRRFRPNPPLLVPFDQLDAEEKGVLPTRTQIDEAWAQYWESLPEERRRLLSRFGMVDLALRVGGVGSVGTRCWILLLEGGAEDDAIILKWKEAGASVLERYTRDCNYKSAAQRVVQGQRLTQAASDIFLGWHQKTVSGIHFYWRQLSDMKGSLAVTGLDEAGFETYLRVCAVCLARAHARTGDAAAISGYAGSGTSLALAIADFAAAYADQTEHDHQSLAEAIESGRAVAQTGI